MLSRREFIKGSMFGIIGLVLGKFAPKGMDQSKKELHRQGVLPVLNHKSKGLTVGAWWIPDDGAPLGMRFGLYDPDRSIVEQESKREYQGLDWVISTGYIDNNGVRCQPLTS